MTPGLKTWFKLTVFVLLLSAATLRHVLYNDTKQTPAKSETVPVLSGEVTIVTLGAFFKGSTPEGLNEYKSWIALFAKIKNPVIVYVEDPIVENYFLRARATQPRNRTKTVLIAKKDSWAYSLQPRIEEIISQPGYPKFHPNTVRPDYAWLMHAKYEVMERSAKQNPFKTKYIAWLDVGLLRGLKGELKEDIVFHYPYQFNEQKIAYAKVNQLQKLSAATIFKTNEAFVSGCYFLGKIDKMISWTLLYKHFVTYYLNENLANTDEQVLYAMAKHNGTVLTKLQTYGPNANANKWFYLGYLSMYQQP